MPADGAGCRLPRQPVCGLPDRVLRLRSLYIHSNGKHEREGENTLESGIESRPEMKLIWSDEFEVDGLPDANK